MKRLLILISCLFLLTACGSGGGGDGVSSELVGRWLILTQDGVDISSAGVVYAVTNSSYTMASNCSETGSFSASGGTWSATVQGTNCSGVSIGTTVSGGYSVSGTSASMTCTASTCLWATMTLSKISSKPN